MKEQVYQKEPRSCLNCLKNAENMPTAPCGYISYDGKHCCDKHLGLCEPDVLWYDESKTSCMVSGEHSVVFSVNGDKAQLAVSVGGVKVEGRLVFLVPDAFDHEWSCRDDLVMKRFKNLLFLLGYREYE